MRYATRIVDRFLEASLVFLMTALVVDVLWQVASRYLFNDPSSTTEEIARFLLLWIGLLGGCYAYRRGSHLGLDIVTAKLPEQTRQIVRGTVLLLSALFASAVLIYGGTRLMWMTLLLRQTSAALGIPMGWVYAVLPFSGLMIVFYSAVLWREGPPFTED